TLRTVSESVRMQSPGAPPGQDTVDVARTTIAAVLALAKSLASSLFRLGAVSTAIGCFDIGYVCVPVCAIISVLVRSAISIMHGRVLIYAPLTPICSNRWGVY